MVSPQYKIEYSDEKVTVTLTGLGKLDHMRVSLSGVLWFLVGCCWVVHLRRREAVGRPETEMVRSSWQRSVPG